MTKRKTAKTAAPRNWELVSKWAFGAFDLFIGYLLSEQLQKFTEAALWMPKEYRIGITFGCSIGFLAVTGLATNLADLRLGHLKEGGEHPSKKARLAAIKRAAVALGFLFWFFICLLLSYHLRTISVWDFEPYPGWWAQQFGDGPTNAPLTNQPDAKLVNVPDFLNQETGKFYFPDEIDDTNLTNYLRSIAGSDGDLRTGIKIAIDREPMRLVVWAADKGGPVRERYNCYFFILHFTMICCAAAAMGVLQKRGELALEAILKSWTS